MRLGRESSKKVGKPWAVNYHWHLPCSRFRPNRRWWRWWSSCRFLAAYKQKKNILKFEKIIWLQKWITKTIILIGTNWHLPFGILISITNWTIFFACSPLFFVCTPRKYNLSINLCHKKSTLPQRKRVLEISNTNSKVNKHYTIAYYNMNNRKPYQSRMVLKRMQND